MIDSVPPLGDPATTMALGAAPALPVLGPNTRIDKAAQDFEAMFATQMLQPMFDTVPVDGAFGGGHGEEVMRSFLLQEYGKQIAKSGRLGIAPQVRAEMLRIQEKERAQGGIGKMPVAAQTAYQNAQHAEQNIGAAYVPAR